MPSTHSTSAAVLQSTSSAASSRCGARSLVPSVLTPPPSRPMPASSSDRASATSTETQITRNAAATYISISRFDAGRHNLYDSADLRADTIAEEALERHGTL